MVGSSAPHAATQSATVSPNNWRLQCQSRKTVEQGKDQKGQPRVEEQAARADVRTIQDLRADQVSVTILPAVGLAR